MGLIYNHGCKGCPLHVTAKNVCIPGRGSMIPKVMFVGQAPGSEENDRNQVFIGPAGQLLLQAIQEFGIKPAFLTNTVKCFPPGDREPKKPEIEACKRYLASEIVTLKPEVIVALGNVPLMALTGKKGVMNYSGTVAGTVGGAKVFSLMHPSYILRYPRDLHKFEMHMRSLKKVIDGDQPKQAANFVAATPADGRVYIMRCKPNRTITFDFETSGKFKHEGGRIRMVSIYIGGGAFVVNAADEGFNEFMVWMLNLPNPKCAFNFVFDARWCLDEWGIMPRNLVLDPYLMHYLVDENSSHELEAVASQIMKSERWDIGPAMIENGWTWETIPYKVLAPYSAIDSTRTAELVPLLIEKMKEQELIKPYREILVPLAALCAKLEHRGIAIDKEWCELYDKRYGKAQMVVIREMLKLPVIRKFALEKGKEFNLNSGVQVGEIVFNRLKLKTTIKTDSGAMSVKEEALAPLKSKSPFIELYLKWKELQTARVNFLQKFPTFQDKNGIVHPSHNPAKVVTGRTAVSNPNAQAFPTDPNVRGMVVSRFEGGHIMSNDFANLEMRLLASESNEPLLLKVFAENGDAHNTTAATMFGENFTKRDRDIAKRINFGTVYGITEFGLSEGFNLPVNDCVNLLNRHRRAHPAIYAWMERQHAFVKKYGFIKSRFGRIRHLPEILQMPDTVNGRKNWRKERILRQTGNFPIQSLGGDINNIFATLLDLELEKAGAESLVFHAIHDDTLVDVYPGEEDMVASIGQQVRKKVQERCDFLLVELKIDQKFYTHWGVS